MIQEKKEYLTPLKKDTEIKNNNIVLKKPKNKPNNKKIILDDDSENPDDIVMDTKEAGKQEKEKQEINDNYINNYKPPSKKVEKLIPISVSDFFNTKKITIKPEAKIIQEKKAENINQLNEVKNEEINNIKNNNDKMEIEEEQKKNKRRKRKNK